jgi:hypothetical protein
LGTPELQSGKSFKKSTGALKILAPYLKKKLQTKFEYELETGFSKEKLISSIFIM